MACSLSGLLDSRQWDNVIAPLEANQRLDAAGLTPWLFGGGPFFIRRPRLRRVRGLAAEDLNEESSCATPTLLLTRSRPIEQAQEISTHARGDDSHDEIERSMSCRQQADV